MLASRQHVLLVLVDPLGHTSGILFRLELLVSLLISSSRVYILGIIYPWPLVIWVVTILISVQYRVAFQRKVLRIIRTDILLTISFTISILFCAVNAVAKLTIAMITKPGERFLLWDSWNVPFCIMFLFFNFYLKAVLN